ncbi:hypothetical protein AB0M43_34980 [Longispora sp. NPDC051575]|uniref:hypothetical protein n=1 Tax=Longispora sp. NPDC051575 TaxID=3154943 RepID=UPI00344AB7D1
MTTDRSLGSRFTASSASSAGAQSQLQSMIVDTLNALCDRPIVVIGGSADYASCIHLIHAQPGGRIVSIIRDGRDAGCWGTAATLDETLAQVLAHVGGDPAVVLL